MLRKGILALACLTMLSDASMAQAEPAKQDATVVAKADESSDLLEDSGSSVKEQTPSEATTPEAKTTPESQPAEAEAKAQPAPLPDPTLKVSIDLASQTLTVREYGNVKYSWPISSGTASHPTPRGTFRPQWTAKMWYSRKYDNAPMPHAVFINGGVAVHATYATKYLGRPASHGCIRLAPSNAKTFYNLVHKHGLKMTRVSVYGTPKYSAPAIARKSAPAQKYASQNSGWSLFDFGSSPSSAYNPNFVKKGKKPAYANSKKSNAQARRYYYKKYGSASNGWW
ncbi:MAG: L,D-transpeptidase family protein [Hyphomicrobiaceae bacterium]